MFNNLKAVNYILPRLFTKFCMKIGFVRIEGYYRGSWWQNLGGEITLMAEEPTSLSVCHAWLCLDEHQETA
jgi:hypothetical protein